MIRLASMIDTFSTGFLAQDRDKRTSGHRQALAALPHRGQREDAGAVHRMCASNPPDSALAGAAEVRSRSRVGLDQAARCNAVYLLRGGDEDRAHANRGVVRRGPADPACGSGSQLIM